MGMIQSYLEKNPVPGWKKEIELGERAVEIVNKMRPKPKFFVMCGDLCHAFPGKNVKLSKPLIALDNKFEKKNCICDEYVINLCLPL